MSVNSLQINHESREFCYEVIEFLEEHVLPEVSWIVYFYFEPTLNPDQIQEFAELMPNSFYGDLHFSPNFNRGDRARCTVPDRSKLIIATLMCVCPDKFIRLGYDPFLEDGMKIIANDCHSKLSGGIVELNIGVLIYYFNEPLIDILTTGNRYTRYLRIYLPENFTHGYIKVGHYPNWLSFPKVVTQMPDEMKCNLLTHLVSKKELDGINTDGEFVTFRALRFAHCEKKVFTNEIFGNKIHCYDFHD